MRTSEVGGDRTETLTWQYVAWVPRQARGSGARAPVIAGGCAYGAGARPGSALASAGGGWVAGGWVLPGRETALKRRHHLLPAGRRCGFRLARGPGSRRGCRCWRCWLCRRLLSVRLVGADTAFQDEGTYLWAGHLEWAHVLHGMPLPPFASYFSGAPVIYPPLGALADSVGGLAGARLLSLVFMLASTALRVGCNPAAVRAAGGVFRCGAVRGAGLDAAPGRHSPPMTRCRCSCWRWPPGW